MLLHSLFVPLYKWQFFALVFCLSYLPVILQAQSDTEVLLEKARTEKHKPTALKYYLKVLNQYEKVPENKAIAKVYQEVGNLYFEWEVYPKAIEYLTKSLDNQFSIEILEKLAYIQTTQRNYQSAIIYRLQLDSSFRQKNQTLELTENLSKLSDLSKNTQNYKEALHYQEEILTIHRDSKNSTKIIQSLNNVGFLYQSLQKNQKALSVFQEAVKIDKEIHGKITNTVMLINIGVTYQEEKNYRKAIEYFLEALKIREKEQNPKAIAEASNYIAGTFFELQNTESAQFYAEKALQNAHKSKDIISLVIAYKRAALIEKVQENYEKALSYREKYEQYAEQLTQKQLSDLQEQFSKELHAEKTEKQLKMLMALQETRELEYRKKQLENDKQKQQLSLTKKELELSKKDRELKQNELQRQQLESQQVKKNLELTQQRLQNTKRQQEIQQLEKDKEIQRLALRESELEGIEKAKALRIEEQKRKLKDLELTEQSTKQKFYLGIILFGLILFGFVIYGYFDKQKANDALQAQKQEIEAQNAELQSQQEEILQTNNVLEKQNQEIELQHLKITASINYAARIQTALLPKLRKIQKSFPESFVFFRPRDIVSGDFYWYAEIHEKHIDMKRKDPMKTSEFVTKQLIAAVDCTGHGVPGAFMSVMANDALNNIVNEHKVTQSNLILNMLHKKIQRSLKQEESNNRDGMDIALCVIDKKNKYLEYSGAHNPLVYVQGDTKERVRGDAQGIGGGNRTSEITFTKHQLNLEEALNFYIFSDGYQDQFGGNKRRKFMSGRFKKLLFSIADKPMEEQGKIVETIFDNWKQGKTFSQLDDVLVIGVRVSA